MWVRMWDTYRRAFHNSLNLYELKIRYCGLRTASTIEVWSCDRPTMSSGLCWVGRIPLEVMGLRTRTESVHPRRTGATLARPAKFLGRVDVQLREERSRLWASCTIRAKIGVQPAVRRPSSPSIGAVAARQYRSSLAAIGWGHSGLASIVPIDGVIELASTIAKVSANSQDGFVYWDAIKAAVEGSAQSPSSAGVS